LIEIYSRGDEILIKTIGRSGGRILLKLLVQRRNFDFGGVREAFLKDEILIKGRAASVEL